MPVVVVTAPRLEDGAAELRAASALAAALAAGLGLRPADVYVTLVAAAVAVLGADAVRPWPVIIIHGRARPGAAAAMQGLGPLAAQLWDVSADHVWVQWLPTDPAA